MDRRLGAACEHDIGATVHDHARGDADRFGTRRAGTHRRVDAGGSVKLKAHRGRRPARHEHRHGVRGDPRGPAFLEGVVGIEQGEEAADARADDRAHAQRVHLGAAGIGPRLARGDEGHLLGSVEFACLDAIQRWLLGEDAGEMDRHLVHPRLGERLDAGATFDERGPVAGHVTAER